MKKLDQFEFIKKCKEVHKNKYDSAIIITASHNPREYNGLKFVTNKALFINEAEVEIIKNRLDLSFFKKDDIKLILFNY